MGCGQRGMCPFWAEAVKRDPLFSLTGSSLLRWQHQEIVSGNALGESCFLTTCKAGRGPQSPKQGRTLVLRFLEDGSVGAQ